MVTYRNNVKLCVATQLSLLALPAIVFREGHLYQGWIRLVPIPADRSVVNVVDSPCAPSSSTTAYALDLPNCPPDSVAARS